MSVTDKRDELGMKKLRGMRLAAMEAVAAGCGRPGTHYGPLAAELEPLAPTVLALLDEIDRLRRERDEAREVVGRVRVAMSNHPDPCAKHPEDEDGDTACGWRRAYADVRAALDDDRASGRDQAARPSSTPKRPAQGATSANPPAGWTYDSAAVRPTEHDDEGEKR